MSTTVSKIYFQLTLIPFSLLSVSSSVQTDNAVENESNFVPFGSLHTLEKLTYWAAKEEEIYRLLALRREALRHEIELIRRYIADYGETSGKALNCANMSLDTTFIMERERLIGTSALLAHRMTDRYTTKVAGLRKHSHEYQQIGKNVSEVFEIQGVASNYKDNWPNRQDLFLSLVSIIGLQHFYSFEADTVFQGLKYDTSFGGSLSPSHCALLGTFAMKFEHFVWSVEWLEFTLAYIEKEFHGKDYSTSPILVKRLLRIAIQTHNHKMGIVESSETFSEQILHFFISPAYLDQDWSTRWHIRTSAINVVGEKYGNGTAAEINMLALCMGSEFQPEIVKSRLFCFLDRKRHPYFILNPLKTEQLSEYPYIVQFYEVLGNDTINELYAQRGELRIATVTTIAKSNVDESLTIRSSAGTSLRGDFMYRIQNKSEILTGLLLTDMFEGLQTVEYTYGRFQKVHTDVLFDYPDASKLNLSEKMDWSVEKYGDRVATLLYYLDVPTDGGNTAFHEVGIAARPVRGSAIFWVNLFRNGTPRADVSHSACPVIHGHKTIINQWIRYNSNFQTFRCSPNQHE